MAKAKGASGRSGLASVAVGAGGVRVPPSDTRETVAGLQRLGQIIGKEVTAENVAALVGALPGTDMRIERNGNSVDVYVTGRTPGGNTIYQHRQISRDGDGKLYVYNAHFELHGGGPGEGGRIFENQVNAMRRAGFSYMTVSAAGSGTSLRDAVTSYRNVTPAADLARMTPRQIERAAVDRYQPYVGYNAWANLGYTGQVAGLGGDPGRHRAVTTAFPSLSNKGRIDVQDILSQPGGQAWWKDNGWGFKGTFDLDPKSQNSKILASNRKGKK